MMNRFVSAVLVIGFAVAGTSIGGAQQRALYQQTQYKGQEIGKLTGDVYFARMDDYVSVFMVTPDGIVLVEPIGTEMAASAHQPSRWTAKSMLSRSPGCSGVRSGMPCTTASLTLEQITAG